MLHPDLSSNASFESAWSHFFPDKIFNNCYKVNEDAFEYILRHTQYRPRQLQLHVIKLCETFKDKQPAQDEIPNVIALSCKERVEDFIEEFRIDHPHLESFLAKFRDCQNVMRYEDFCKRVGDVLRRMNLTEITEIDVIKKVEKLYHIGFVGSLKAVEDHEYESKKHAFYFPPNRVGGKKYKSEFYYEDGAFQDFRNLSPDDLVCIHSMFHDYCKSTPNEKYIIG